MLLNPRLHSNDHFDIDEALEQAEKKKRNIYNEDSFDDEDEYDDEELDEDDDESDIKQEEFVEEPIIEEMCPGPQERHH